MNISRRHFAGPLSVLGLVTIGMLGAKAAQEMSADEEAVAKRVEAFRSAQFAADAKALDGLCAAELSYSHSDGHVEDKATFITNATAGKSKFLSLEYKDPSIRVVGDAAIVRFHWLGESESIPDGKRSSTNLHILMNWQKQGGEWNLLSRIHHCYPPSGFCGSSRSCVALSKEPKAAHPEPIGQLLGEQRFAEMQPPLTPTYIPGPICGWSPTGPRGVFTKQN
jgi:ketosteroid isomerase-like protein